MRKNAATKFDRFKSKNGNPKKNDGDFHTLMAQMKSMNKMLAKAVKKTQITSEQKKETR